MTAAQDWLDVEVVPDSGAPAVDAPPLFEVEHEPAVQATVEFCGRRFPVRPQGVSLLALMKFATAAKRQQAVQRGSAAPIDEMDGLDALYALIRSCIAPDSWDEFEQHGIDEGAGAQELMGVVRDAVQAAAARPTSLPSDSRGGQSTTGPSSAGGSSSPVSSSEAVQARLEQRGRPDLARVVQIARSNGVGA